MPEGARPCTFPMLDRTEKFIKMISQSDLTINFHCKYAHLLNIVIKITTDFNNGIDKQHKKSTHFCTATYLFIF